MEQKKNTIHNKTANSYKLNFVASRDFKLPLIILSSYYFKFFLKGWGKTKLSDGFDLDDMMRDPDFEEELLLNEKMSELMLDDESIENELNDVIEVNADKEKEENEVPDVDAEKKEKKQY